VVGIFQAEVLKAKSGDCSLPDSNTRPKLKKQNAQSLCTGLEPVSKNNDQNSKTSTQQLGLTGRPNSPPAPPRGFAGCSQALTPRTGAEETPPVTRGPQYPRDPPSTASANAGVFWSESALVVLMRDIVLMMHMRVQCGAVKDSRVPEWATNGTMPID